MREVLRKLFKGENLSFEEASSLFGAIFDGKIEESLVSAALVALSLKGETPEELAAAISEANARKVKVNSGFEVIDTCGTGGDGASTFNVSTAAAFIARALGAKVAKHGNKAVTGKLGSADVIESLGIPMAKTKEEAEKLLSSKGFVFLFAPAFHPAFKKVAPVRRALGVPTVFNLLGPMVNPADPEAQLIGFYSYDKMLVAAEALRLLGVYDRILVHAEEGLDEVSTEGVTKVIEIRKEGVRSYDFEAIKLLGKRFPVPRVSSRDEGINLFKKALNGEHEEAALSASLNCAFALYATGKKDLDEAFTEAKKAVFSGKVAELVEELRDGLS